MTPFTKMTLLLAMALSFFGSVTAKPVNNETAAARTQKNEEAVIDVESASGKITAVQNNSFTIGIPHNQSSGEPFRQEEHPASMIFLINSGTKIEGKLEIGANADVLYQRQEGNNIAVTVYVTTTS